MTPDALLVRLTNFFPDFRSYWDDPGNCFRDEDDTFTLHGVFAVFSHFFRERYASQQVLSPHLNGEARRYWKAWGGQA